MRSSFVFLLEVMSFNILKVDSLILKGRLISFLIFYLERDLSDSLYDDSEIFFFSNKCASFNDLLALRVLLSYLI